MLPIDPLSLIPNSLKTVVRDAMVDFASAQDKKFLENEIPTKQNDDNYQRVSEKRRI